ncbi:hypothetical protein AL052_01120 [Pseudomonas amygdali pv. eriobotryae]|nr:hypothetical protein AL052_01120 [Pseudomonas amygdali pv. eriobotryae]
MLLDADSPLKIRPAYLGQIFPWLLRMALASRPSRVEEISASLAALLKGALSAHKEISEAINAHTLVRPSGYLRVFETEEGFARSAGDREIMARREVPFEVMDKEAIRSFDPMLAPIFSKAIFHQQCHSIADPTKYITMLRDFLTKQGVAVIPGLVSNFEILEGRATAALTQMGPVAGDEFVIAAGAWSKNLAKQLGNNVPLDTERGYHMMLRTETGRSLRAPVLWTDRSIVMSPIAGSIRVTSSVEFAGLTAAPNFDLVKKSLPFVKQAVPEINSKPESLWLGFRPSMPDSSAVIGQSTGAPNAWLAFGHGHLGLTLGPETGRLIAGMIDGSIIPAHYRAFAPQRFAH